MMKKLNESKIHALHHSLEKELDTIVPIIILCGQGKCKEDIDCESCEEPKKETCIYNQRMYLKQELRKEGCIPIIFEEDFEMKIASLEETIILRNPEVALIFIIPSSLGSAAELGIFMKDNIIKPKLRVLVESRYHPMYSTSKSFLTSVYTELIATHGHIYPFNFSGDVHPTPLDWAKKIIESYRLYLLATRTN